MKSKETIRSQMLNRLALIYFGLLIFLLVLILQILNLQWLQGSKWRSIERQHFRTVKLEPQRGEIRARDGRPLASSVPRYEVRLDFGSKSFNHHAFNKGIDSLSLLLSRLFGDKSENEYRQLLLGVHFRKERYYLFKKGVTYQQMKKMKNFPVFREGKYKGGFILEPSFERVHPFGELAERTIGYLFSDSTRKGVGIEGTYDSLLAGVEGRRLEQRLAGNFWKPVDSEIDVEPEAGYDILTTIDVNIQDVAHDALLRNAKKHNARHGAAILMEVNSGEILAISNLQRLSDGEYHETYNFAIGERTEPGSTIKLASLMIALGDGYVNLNDVIDTGNGEYKLYDLTIRDSKEGGYGRLTVQEVFEHSSNIGVVKIIQRYYADRHKDFVEKLYRMRLNEPTGIDILGEPRPYIKYPGDKYWSGVSLYQMAYGYELQLTPLQILNFYNAVANNGKMMRPHLIKAIYKKGSLVKSISPEVIDTYIASPKVIKQAHQMLEGVVERGTATNLKGQAFKIAGKTGTAQIANAKYGYEYQSRISYLASFVGYFPADDPKYSCIVVVNEPSNSQYYGNTVAGPVFREIAEKVYATRPDMIKPIETVKVPIEEKIPYCFSGHAKDLLTLFNMFDFNVTCKNDEIEWASTQKGQTSIVVNARAYYPGQVPNVIGMGLRDAIALCENVGLRVQVEGYGIVKQQSLQPYSNVIKGQTIVLFLSSNF